MYKIDRRGAGGGVQKSFSKTDPGHTPPWILLKIQILGGCRDIPSLLNGEHLKNNNQNILFYFHQYLLIYFHH